ncbi:hypothetical protein [Vibrio gangliei]|uniref:hypothetical protein n=1 Tax=Vibrio gangliei TaxID=2077090 RepID=UPI001FE39880|nr:hypothetical protein [Vibrio gangliei]
MNQTYAKAAIAGIENNERSGPNDLPVVEVNGHPLELKYGYPEVYAEGSNSYDILDLIDVSGFKTCLSTSCISSNSSRVKIGYDTTEDTGCYVRYSEPGGTGAPSETMYGLITVTEGC